MREADWTLEYPGTTFVFGDAAGPIPLEHAPEVTYEVTTDDAARPRADGIAFGQDYFGGATMTFEALIVGPDEATVRGLAGQFARAWRGDRVRSTPGAVATLTGRIGSERRSVFGRPRRFTTDDEYAPQGLIRVTAEFQCVDNCTYSAAMQSENLYLVTADSATGGLVETLTEPLSTTGVTESIPGSVVIGGDGPAWPVIEVFGPVTNLRLIATPGGSAVNGWTLSVGLSVPADDSLVIDSRPWKRSITRASDGAAFPGALAWDSATLSQLWLDPGPYALTLRGLDSSGRSYVHVAWQTTHPQTL